MGERATVRQEVADVRLEIRFDGRDVPTKGDEHLAWIRRQDVVRRLILLLDGANLSAGVSVRYETQERCSACGEIYEEARYDREDTSGETGLGCAYCGAIHKPDVPEATP